MAFSISTLDEKYAKTSYTNLFKGQKLGGNNAKLKKSNEKYIKKKNQQKKDKRKTSYET